MSRAVSWFLAWSLTLLLISCGRDSTVQSEGTSTASSLDRYLAPLGIRRGVEPQLRPGRPGKYPSSSKAFHGQTFYTSIDVPLETDEESQRAKAWFSLLPDPTQPGRKIDSARSRRVMPITEILPSFVSEKLGRFARSNGPNCSHAALSFHDPSTPDDYVHFPDLFKALDTRYKPLGRGALLRAGDLVVMWNPKESNTDNRGFIHTGIYLGDTLFFTKGSTQKSDPYVFETWDQMTSYYTKNLPGFTISFHRFQP